MTYYDIQILETAAAILKTLIVAGLVIASLVAILYFVLLILGSRANPG